jgi:hypothetical protein
VDVAEIGARVVERLTGTTARLTMTGVSFGLGLTTPVKAIVPKVRGTKGAWAAEGAVTVTVSASASGAMVLIWTIGVAAEAGSERVATIAPDITIMAEALPAGLAEREIADEKDVDAELKRLGARWRPEVWLDTVRNLPSAYEVSCRVRVGDCTRPSRRQID